MTELEATHALREASRLTTKARRAGRWYATFLVILAVGTFAMCVGFGLLGGKWGAIVLTPIWGLLIAALCIWAARQRTALVGMTRLHLTMMGAWAAAGPSS